MELVDSETWQKKKMRKFQDIGIETMQNETKRKKNQPKKLKEHEWPVKTIQVA